MACDKPAPAKRGNRSKTSAIGKLFGLTLLQGRDVKGYQSLLDRVQNALEPEDSIEECWIHNIVDLTWEMLELRRLRGQLMILSAHQELMQTLLTNLTMPLSTTPDPATVQGWETVFESVGLDSNGVTAKTIAIELGTIGQIGRMLAATQASCDAILVEIERRRIRYEQPADRLAMRMRYVLNDILFDDACEEPQAAEVRHD